MALISGGGKKGLETQTTYLQAQGSGEINSVYVIRTGLPKKMVLTSIDSGCNIKYETSSTGSGYISMSVNTEYTIADGDTDLVLLLTKTTSDFAQKKAYITFTY